MTTGIVEGHAAATQSIEVTGGAGFHLTLHADSDGAFTITLPYGRYRFSGVPVYVAPLQTTRVDLVAATSRQLPAAGLWADPSRAQTYPEAVSSQGVLLSREPATVTEPLDFLGLSDYRLALVSQRATSWTDTQFMLQGMDATDPYQPGLPVILPNVEAMDEMVVRSAFAGTTSASPGTEVGFFLAEPGTSGTPRFRAWTTGSGLASSNLPSGRPRAGAAGRAIRLVHARQPGGGRARYQVGRLVRLGDRTVVRPDRSAGDAGQRTTQPGAVR